jgi:hypothetical protein
LSSGGGFTANTNPEYIIDTDFVLGGGGDTSTWFYALYEGINANTNVTISIPGSNTGAGVVSLKVTYEPI